MSLPVAVCLLFAETEAMIGEFPELASVLTGLLPKISVKNTCGGLSWFSECMKDFDGIQFSHPNSATQSFHFNMFKSLTLVANV